MCMGVFEDVASNDPLLFPIDYSMICNFWFTEHYEPQNGRGLLTELGVQWSPFVLQIWQPDGL